MAAVYRPHEWTLKVSLWLQADYPATSRVRLLYPQQPTFKPHVRFRADFVCSTPRNRRSRWGRGITACDPKEKSAEPEEVENWSLSALREKLIKIGARVMRHGRYVTFQLAAVSTSRALFAKILRRIDRLRPAPLPP